jgi:hypothetical protein
MSQEKAASAVRTVEIRKSVDAFCERHPDWMEWLDLPPREMGVKFRTAIDDVMTRAEEAKVRGSVQ